MQASGAGEAACATGSPEPGADLAKPGGLPIRQWMRAGVALVVALTAVACGTNVWDSYRLYRQGSLDLRDFGQVERAMVALNRVSAERWPANVLLAHRRSDAAADVAAVSVARGRSDEALDALRTQLEQSGVLDALERGIALHAIESIRTELADARHEIDVLAAQPSSARAVWQIQSAQDRMVAAGDDLATLARDVMASAAMRHPDTANALMLAYLLGDLREYTGRLGGLFVASLTRNTPLDDERLARILQMRGRIVQLRALIAGAIAPQRADATLANDFARLNDTMDGSLLPLVSATIRAGRTGRYAMSAEDFTRRIMRDLRPAEQLRDRVLDVTRSRAVEQRNAARLRMAWSAAEAACCVVILILLVRGTQRTLSKPLDALSRGIVALSQGDPLPLVAVPGKGPEIARLNDALDRLRGAYARREVLERQRNDMLTLFSHDMRAPLTSVVVLVGAPEPCQSDCTLRERLHEIGRLARHTLAMADGFAQVSRAEAGEYAPELVNVADLMNQARDEVWPHAREKDIDVGDVPPCEDALVYGDPVLLSRALVKLLGNAVEYSASHTRVECRVGLTEDRASVRCVIRDRGYGIAAEDQARLFERYQRFRLEGQPDSRGVGLGMAFAKAVVERHRGEIGVSSAAWKGTTVTVTLPAAGAGAGDAADAMRSTAGGGTYG
ncbi:MULTISPECIES: sensor histidine kinase [Burkholderia]|uniref:histidine kinase n=1 Tax=Burkholderia paludis TaxID=1506587 RepID=A0A6J5EYX3_9BURK|nr:MULTISPECIES: HAMP domain-containing sensor histidine kinase [Burkholderia]CAB3770226.1 Adaptive-response sensory-kinase SasA [Burkholderia paludis]VWB92245.1 ATPase [Burkholderia paludis]